jgi:lysophospholipase L1-like esterase
VTANIFRASQGGQSRNGEAPQADRLLTVAQQKNVKMVVLSIGGNDLGFSDIIIAARPTGRPRAPTTRTTANRRTRRRSTPRCRPL